MTNSELFETGSASSAGSGEGLFYVFVVMFLVSVVAYILNGIFMGMIFKKAEIPSWKAWVPVYNIWTFLEMGEQKGWLSLITLLAWIPFINIVAFIILAVFMCIAAYKIGLGFGKESWFVLVYIFLGLVWFIWLAVDKTAVWHGNDVTTPTHRPTPPAKPQQPS